MRPLLEITATLDEWLKPHQIPDYPQAMNGLQMEKAGGVSKVVAAVDACLPVIEQACELDADLLIVHHGMFWNGAQHFTGSHYAKIKRAMDHGLAIYSSHIPLDVHPELGNNARLIEALNGASSPTPFFDWKGIQLGLKIEEAWSLDELTANLRIATGADVHLCPGGPAITSSIGVITGGAGSEIFKIAESGVDTFITGEGPHWSYTAAEELGINLFYAGHYATETFGVKAISEKLCREYPELSWDFIDHPTGL